MDKSINLDPNLALKLPLTDHSTNSSIRLMGPRNLSQS